MDRNVSNRLSKSSASRSVTLLQNQQVALAWDCVTLAMRMADLIVLNNTLKTWMENREREWVEVYRLSLNDSVLFIDCNDLYRFCAMIQEATEQLPRRTVRWADSTIRIAPYATEQTVNVGCFSRN